MNNERRAGSFLKHRISLEIQIAIAACVLGTVNDKTTFEEIVICNFFLKMCLQLMFVAQMFFFKFCLAFRIFSVCAPPVRYAPPSDRARVIT